VADFTGGRRHVAVADLGIAGAPLPLRLLRVKRPNGSRLVLVTNLFDDGLDPGAFADLYRARWRIEEAFKLVKARLQVENWSGMLPHTVELDIYASLLRANCAAVLAPSARPQDATLSTDAGVDPAGCASGSIKLRAVFCRTDDEKPPSLLHALPHRPDPGQTTKRYFQ